MPATETTRKKQFLTGATEGRYFKSISANEPAFQVQWCANPCYRLKLMVPPMALPVISSVRQYHVHKLMLLFTKIAVLLLRTSFYEEPGERN